MKRYNIDNLEMLENIEVLLEDLDGIWIKYTDHEAEVEKLKEQNREMLLTIKNCIRKLEDEGIGTYGLREYIGKVEGDSNDKF